MSDPITPEHNSVPVPEQPAPQFREGLKVGTGPGNCAITGLPSFVVGIELGGYAVRFIDAATIKTHANIEKLPFYLWPFKRIIERAVTNVKPTFGYNDDVIEAMVTISAPGLQLLAEQLGEQLAIHIEPKELIYGFRVLYKDGGVFSQFDFDPVSGEPRENVWEEVEQRFADVAQVSLIPREDNDLPTYTFNRENGKFFRNGEEFDPGYTGVYDAEKALPWRFNRVTQVLNSFVNPGALQRDLSKRLDSVQYRIGWKEGWLTDEKCRACIIGVDKHGNWRLIECREEPITEA